MSKLSVGDRVKLYGPVSTCAGSFSYRGAKATVADNEDPSGSVYVKLDERFGTLKDTGPYQVHAKQCRRLKKKTIPSLFINYRHDSKWGTPYALFTSKEEALQPCNKHVDYSETVEFVRKGRVYR